MPTLVVANAPLKCTMGTSPAPLQVPLPTGVGGVQQAAGTAVDMLPFANVGPFGMCNSPSNPQVAAATAAAGGVLTPQPCIPIVTAPWTGTVATVKVGNQPALQDSSTCSCMWGGTVAPASPGQSTVKV